MSEQMIQEASELVGLAQTYHDVKKTQESQEIVSATKDLLQILYQIRDLDGLDTMDQLNEAMQRAEAQSGCCRKLFAAIGQCEQA